MKFDKSCDLIIKGINRMLSRMFRIKNMAEAIRLEKKWKEELECALGVIADDFDYEELRCRGRLCEYARWKTLQKMINIYVDAVMLKGLLS